MEPGSMRAPLTAEAGTSSVPATVGGGPHAPGSSACPFTACARISGEEASTSLAPHYAELLEGPWPGEEWRLPLVYSPRYNVSFGGIEKLHPFDSCKFEKVVKQLKRLGHLDPKGRRLVVPKDPGQEVLRDVHTEQYITELHTSNFRVAQVTELGPIVILPRWLVQWRVVEPMRVHVAGTMVAAALAARHGWAINMGGGMHHAYSSAGMGWCMFADIMLAVRQLRKATGGRIQKVLYIDLDAHQGNGVERDKMTFEDYDDFFIVDVYNRGIFPRDFDAKPGIDVDVGLRSLVDTESYLQALEGALEEVEQKGFKPDLVFYNAGTDILAGDPLGRMSVSQDGVLQRDEMVWKFALKLQAPIVMTLSGGYAAKNAEVVAASLDRLFTAFSLGSTATQPVPQQ